MDAVEEARRAWELAIADLEDGPPDERPDAEARAAEALEALGRALLGPDLGGIFSASDELEIVNGRESYPGSAFKQVPTEKLSVASKIRLATIGGAFARGLFVRDRVAAVALAAIHSPGMTDSEVVRLAADPNLGDEVILAIADTKEWTKLYAVKVNLVHNPKCPLLVWMRLLPHLPTRELRDLGPPARRRPLQEGAVLVEPNPRPNPSSDGARAEPPDVEPERIG